MEESQETREEKRRDMSAKVVTPIEWAKKANNLSDCQRARGGGGEGKKHDRKDNFEGWEKTEEEEEKNKLEKKGQLPLLPAHLKGRLMAIR